MKLSAEQIEYVDYILSEHYSFKNFDDVRIELVDHISTDVEAEMKNNQMILFDDALTRVLFKWKDEISWDRTSKYDSVPKMVSKLWKKLDWKYKYCILPLTTILCFGSMLYRKENWVTYMMYIFGGIGLVLGFYLMKLFSKNRFNTALSMYAEDQIKIYVGVLVLALIINLGVNYSDGDLLSQPALFVIVHTTLVFVMRTILMRKNIKIGNQLLKVM